MGTSSEVANQVSAEADAETQEQVLMAIIGTRTPATVSKRVDALLHYYRWFPVHLRFLQMSGAAPTKATSFIQAVRFGHFVLKIGGAEQCMNSRRLVGSAELQLSLKPPTRQKQRISL